MATPYLDEAERCARVALMSEGRLLALDLPGSLRQAFPGDIVEVIAHPQPAAQRVLRDHPAVTGVEEFGERLHAYVAKGTGDTAAARLAEALTRAGVTVTGVRDVPASLEDVFIERVASSRAPLEVSQ